MGRARKKALDVCKHHGLTDYGHDGTTSRCKKCNADRVANARVRHKQRLVDLFGGACMLCGYSRCVGALKFHHVDPATKDFGLAAGGLLRSWKLCLAEAMKCVLLCGNCHDEIHAGLHPQTAERLHEEFLRDHSTVAK